MAAELEQACGAEVRLIEGSGGVFEVVVDGHLRFSKAKLGRFPEPGEMTRMLAQT